MGIRRVMLIAVCGGHLACSGGNSTARQQQQVSESEPAERSEPSGTTNEVLSKEDVLVEEPTQVSGAFLVECKEVKSDVPLIEPAEGEVIAGCTVLDHKTRQAPEFVRDLFKVTLQTDRGEKISSELTRPSAESGVHFYITATLEQLAGTLSILAWEVVDEGYLLNCFNRYGRKFSNEQLLDITTDLNAACKWAAFGEYINEMKLSVTALKPLPEDGKHWIFVSHRAHTPNFQGFQGADAICQDAGKIVDDQRDWVALISTSTVDARDRVEIKGRIYNLMAELVAENANDLWGLAMSASVQWTEHGFNTKDRIDLKLFEKLPVTIQVDQVWTGSTADGRFDPETGSCEDWTSLQVEDHAMAGVSHGGGNKWFAVPNKRPCATGARIYCISK